MESITMTTPQASRMARTGDSNANTKDKVKAVEVFLATCTAAFSTEPAIALTITA